MKIHIVLLLAASALVAQQAPTTSHAFVPSGVARRPRFAVRLGTSATTDRAPDKPRAYDKDTAYCIPLEDIALDDLPKVGG